MTEVRILAEVPGDVAEAASWYDREGYLVWETDLKARSMLMSSIFRRRDRFTGACILTFDASF